jgi:hypothetical protein
VECEERETIRKGRRKERKEGSIGNTTIKTGQSTIWCGEGEVGNG